MSNMSPLFDVKEGADNFSMIDCEVVNTTGRPVMKSVAKNTRVIRLKLFNTEIKVNTLKKWGIGGLASSFAVGLVLLYVDHYFFK